MLQSLTIHVYWSSIFLLPKAVIKEINKLLKGFLWNQDEVGIGKAKVAWKYVCRSKIRGLGLKDLHMWNKAMIVKHLWHVVGDKDSLWVKWITTVKIKGRSVWVVDNAPFIHISICVIYAFMLIY